MFTCGTGRMVCLPVVQVEWYVYLSYRQSGAFTCGTGRVACLPVIQAEWCIYQ